eukprot:6176343-Pleurochrysis_carterae.AAC.4
MWPSGLPAKQSSVITLASAAIPCVRMARPFVARAHAILKELVYSSLMTLTNDQNYLSIDDAARASWETPILTAPPPALRSIHVSITHIGKVRPAYHAHELWLLWYCSCPPLKWCERTPGCRWPLAVRSLAGGR